MIYANIKYIIKLELKLLIHHRSEGERRIGPKKRLDQNSHSIK